MHIVAVVTENSIEDIQKIKRSSIWPNNRNTNYIQRKHAQETSGVIYMWK